MSKAMNVNVSNFDSEVLHSDIPVLVDFWAGWCMPCKMLAPVVDELATDFASKVKVVKVDVDSNQPLAANYDIRGIPSLLIFNKGRLADRLVGVQSKSEIARKLNTILGR